MRRRKSDQSPKTTGDPLLDALRDADAQYHALCVDIQEPMVPIEELRLDDLAGAVEHLRAAIEALRQRP